MGKTIWVEPLVNEATGKLLVPVPTEVDGVIISVIPNSGRTEIEMCCEYAAREFAYYDFFVSKPNSIVLEVAPITDDGSVGCQHVVEFPDANSRRHWSEKDNEDNAEGRAFRSWTIKFEAPAENKAFGFTLIRKVKFYQSIREPVDGPGGKYERSRRLHIRIAAKANMTFDEYVQSRLMEDENFED